MKTVKLRVEVTVEDAVAVEQAQARLIEILNAAGTENLPGESGGDLAGTQPGPRIFWITSSVKQGLDRVTVEPKRSKAAR